MFRNAGRRFRINVQATHFNVFHTALGQGSGRAFAALGGAFGANTGVVLVFDLQNVGVELNPLAIAVGTQLLVIGPRGHGSVIHAHHKGVQVVVAKLKFGLGFLVVIAQIAHAQTGGPGHGQRVVVDFVQIVAAPLQEVGIQHGRGAKQVHQEPGIAGEIADQRQITIGALVL